MAKSTRTLRPTPAPGKDAGQAQATAQPAESAAELPAQPEIWEPDLVDAIFDYLLREHPAVAGLTDVQELKRLTREQFGGEKAYVRRGRDAEEQQRRLEQVLRLFNGRNASEIARRLGIGRATVYRLLKQARRDRVSRVPVT